MLSKTRNKPIEDSQNIYYSIQKYNFGDDLSFSPDGKIPCTYSEVRQTPLLPGKGSSYKLAVLKLSISFDQIPMFLVGDHVFSVGLVYRPDGIIITQPLFQTTSPLTEIISMNQMLDMFQGVNDSYQTAFNNLIVAYDAIHGPGSYVANPLLPHSPPYIVYDEVTQLFSAYFPIEGQDSAGTVEVYMSYTLSRLFIGLLTSPNVFPSNSTSTRISFVEKPLGKNIETIGGDDYIVNTQIFTSTELWYDTHKLILSSNLGVRDQVLGQFSNSNVNNRIFPILTDYTVQTSAQPNSSPASLLIYYPQSEYKWCDILSDQPLSNLTFEFNILTKRGQIRRLFLKPGDFFDVTFIFSNNTV